MIMKISMLALMALSLTLSGCLTRKLLYYPRPISEERLMYLRTNYQSLSEIVIPIRDGKKLHGWLLEKNLDQYPTIIYFGGNAEEVSTNVDAFHSKLNANILLINYRGYGLSDGKPTEKNLLSDSERIYHHLIENLKVPAEKVLVMGRSLGSGIAIHLAIEKKINRLILVTPYDSIENVAADYYPRFLIKILLPDKFKSIDKSPRLQSEVLFLTAEKDQVIPVKHADHLFQQILSEKKMVRIRNADHNNIANFSEYWTAIQEFIATN